MEGPANDSHSDSDSGESWTLLEPSPSYTTTPSPLPTPNFTPAVSAAETIGDGPERDDDTDGISIISECESESMSSCELVHREDIPPDNSRDTYHLIEQTDFTSVTPDPVIPEPDESTNYEDILGDPSKLKTYVHKRNNKVSSMLNVILLGSVITAAGIALGHIWGVRDDCIEQSTPSVNKILSNLYKLQEENAFLRRKLKELTLAGHFQLQQKKVPGKPKQCKKVFEEPLQSANVVKTTKCVDPDVDIRQPLVQFKTDLTLPLESTDDNIFESAVDEEDFKNDITKLKTIYNENRKWLDEEVIVRMKNEKFSAKSQKPKNHEVPLKNTNVEENKEPKENKRSAKRTEDIPVETRKQDKPIKIKKTDENKNSKAYIVSYADSVKHGFAHKRSIDSEEDIRKMEEWELKTNRPYKKKYRPKREKTVIEMSEDEGALPREIRGAKKYKSDKPKNDRHKNYHKQKRDNKYEQWEMKGGYMKDYDSVASLKSLENITPTDDNKNLFSPDWDLSLNYMSKFSELKTSNAKAKSTKEQVKNDLDLVNKTARETFNDSKKNKYSNSKKSRVNSAEDNLDFDWFSKRSAMRRHAREALEKPMPLNSKLLMNSRWYFRRMNEREHLRTHHDDIVQRKNQHRNFKYGH